MFRKLNTGSKISLITEFKKILNGGSVPRLSCTVLHRTMKCGLSLPCLILSCIYGNRKISIEDSIGP